MKRDDAHLKEREENEREGCIQLNKGRECKTSRNIQGETWDHYLGTINPATPEKGRMETLRETPEGK